VLSCLSSIPVVSIPWLKWGQQLPAALKLFHNMMKVQNIISALNSSKAFGVPVFKLLR